MELGSLISSPNLAMTFDGVQSVPWSSDDGDQDDILAI
jgi:hypothetical protein